MRPMRQIQLISEWKAGRESQPIGGRDQLELESSSGRRLRLNPSSKSEALHSAGSRH